MSAVGLQDQSTDTGAIARVWSTPAGRGLASALAYAICAELSLAFALGPTQQPVFFPAAGVGLAIVITAGNRSLRLASLAGVGLGCLGWAVIRGYSVGASVGLALTAMLGAAAGSWVVRTFAPQDRQAHTLRGMACLLGPATLLAAALSASSAVLTVAWLTELRSPKLNLGRVWTGRMMADTVGVFLAAPILIWLTTIHRQTKIGWRRLEGTLILIGTAIGAAAIFGTSPASTGTALALVCLPIPLLVLAATRLGTGGTSAAALLCGAFLVWFANAGLGPIAALNASPHDEILGIQFYMAIITGSALLLGATVTDWRRTERLLRASESRYREFISHSSEGVWCIDMGQGVPTSTPTDQQIEIFYQRARLSECNDAMARMYGLARASDLADVPLDRLMVRDDPRNTAYLTAFIESGYRLENAESHERDVDGNDKYFLNSLVGVVEHGRIVRAWGTQRDLTAARQAERELERTRERLSSAMAAADLASWSLDFRTGSLSFDDTVRRLYSLPQDTQSPLPVDFFLERMHPDDVGNVRQRLEVARRGSDRYRAEYRVPQANGGERWMSSRGSVQTDADGVPILLTGFCADVTEIKHAASEREQLHAQLRHSQKLESLGLMASGIAHDFNNLLVGIMGSAGIAMKQVTPGDPIGSTISNIEQSARRAADLTMQLLAYAGKSQFAKEQVDLRRLVADVLPMLQSGNTTTPPFTADLSPATPSVLADPTQLRQVLMNLAGNAREAIEEGTRGEVRIRTGRVEISRQYLDSTCLHAESLEPGTYAFLDVEDTGRGMDEATVARIFDPFYTTKFTGRGLGLAVVLGIIRAHQGTIAVTSSNGHGSTFRVLLPAVLSPQKSPPTVEPKPRPASTGGGRVLIVDDEKMVREVTAKMLQRAGWETVAVAEGAEAISLLVGEGAKFDAVVLDATMPGMSGLEVLREIRRTKPELPVLLSSGYTQESLDGALEVKPDGFLQKPFSPDALVSAVAAVTAAPRRVD